MMKKQRLLQSVVLVLVGIGIGACVRQVAPAIAQSTAHKCDYTYVSDTVGPEIGTNGDVEYDADWKRVLDAGFTLKLQVADNGYIFERCR